MDYAKEIYTDKYFGGSISPVFGRLKDLYKDKRVLDLACGDGEYLSNFSKSSVGVDISEKNIDYCKKRGLNVLYANLNKELPFFDNSFDVIYASNIIEHVESPFNFLRECRRIVKSDGYIILCIPNEQSLIHLIYPYFDKEGKHLYAFTLNNIRALLRAAKLNEYSIVADCHSMKTNKLHLTWMLNQVGRFPLKCISRLIVFYWVIAQKI